jgi:hypothetical protein
VTTQPGFVGHRAPATISRRGTGPVAGHGRREGVGIWSYIRGLSVSQWLLLAYPVVIRMVSRSRAAEEAFAVDRSAMVQVAFTALCGAYVCALLLGRRRKLHAILARRPMIWLLLYGVLGIASAIWSERPDFTLYRAVELTIFLMLSVDAMATARDLRTMVKFQMIFAAEVIALGMLVPSGLTIAGMHSSEVPGTVAGVVFVGLLVRGPVWRLLYLMILAAVVLGTSAGTFVSIAIGLGIMLVSLRGRWAGVGAILLVSVIGVGLASNFDFDRYIFWGKSESDIKTGSGRLLVWDWVLREKISQKPMLGYGFGVGETLARRSDPTVSTLQMMHMHSAAMSALANLGGVGLLLLLVFLVDLWRSSWKLSRVRAGPALLGAMVTVFANSLLIASVTSTMSVAAIGHCLLFSTIAVASHTVAAWAKRAPARGAMTAEKKRMTAPTRQVSLGASAGSQGP